MPNAPDDDENLSIEESYESMLAFLELLGDELLDASVRDILSGGALVGWRTTVDPGMWSIWEKAVNMIRARREA